MMPSSLDSGWILAVLLVTGATMGGCGGAYEASRGPAPQSPQVEVNAEYFRDTASGSSSPTGYRTTVQQPVFDPTVPASGEESNQTRSTALDSYPARGTVVGLGDAPVKVAPAVEVAQAEIPGAAAAKADVPKAADAAKPVPLARRIIYTATQTLVVKDFAEAESQIGKLVEKHDGYVAKTNVTRRTGTNRTGEWVIRIPVPAYRSFLDELGSLGIPENLLENAQDVTQEFIDLEARISNQKRLEDRLIKLLENREGELKEVIEVERELARVRSEIEQMQGRLRYLQNQVALTTVTIHVREEQNYVPPQAPTFGARIAGTWGESLSGMKIFGQMLVLATVALTPWIAVLVVIVLLIRAAWRRSRRSRQATV